MSNVLCALNPYEKFENQYGLQQMKQYVTNESLQNAPHIYGIGICYLCSFFQQNIFTYAFYHCDLANEARKNLDLYKKNQSILITGVSGSGKTENARHIIEFLTQQSNSQNVLNSNAILEAFGNAKTRANSNSSRFCKHIEVRCILETINSSDQHQNTDVG